MCFLVLLDVNSDASGASSEIGFVSVTSVARGEIVGIVEAIILVAAGDSTSRGVVVGIS